MNFTNANIILVSMMFAIGSSMPISNDELVKLSKTASQPCVPKDSRGYQPTSAMLEAASKISNTPTNFHKFHLELQELRDIANNTNDTVIQWRLPLMGQRGEKFITFVENIIQIPVSLHDNLTTEENSHLHIHLQFIIYEHFMKQLENDPAFNSAKELIQSLHIKIRQASCTLRRLLYSLDNKDIEDYAKQDLSGHIILIKNCNAPLKRAVSAIIVNAVLSRVSKIKVLEDTGSFALLENEQS